MIPRSLKKFVFTLVIVGSIGGCVFLIKSAFHLVVE